MNNKGQFSIIAALLVAVVLIGSVMTTYSAIRYSPVQGQPQILSSVDESNQALKQLLGFTVGYYGSVLKVTGNVTYAQQLANNYFDSGLTNAGAIKPEWGLSLNNTNLELKANWFTNDSYSQGDMNVTYDLNGLGITGVSYSASTRLEVQVSDINSTTQAQFKILTDNGEPLINLGDSSIKFYRYVYGNLTWDFSSPTNIISNEDGTYLVDLPPGVSGNSYVVQVEDTRGLSVLASAFSEFTTSIAWNTTGFKLTPDYVDSANLNVLGTHSNFNAQQNGPDGIYDTLTEAASGSTYVPSYPTNYNLLGSTTLTGGSTSSLQVNDGSYMSFDSYVGSFGGSAIFGYNTQGGSTTGINNIVGSKFTITQAGLATNITAYLNSGGSAFKAQAAIYSSDGSTRIGTTEGKVFNNANGWVTFNFISQPILAASTDYVLVVWSNSSNVNIYRDNGAAERFQASGTYSTWPASVSDQGSKRTFSIYCTYSPANQYTAQVELTGNSTASFPWADLAWTVDGSASQGGVSATFRLYNSATGQYASSGDGFMTVTLGAGDQTKLQTIITNPASFLNSSGYWKVNITAVKSTSTPFDLNLDFVQYNPDTPNYALNLQEQWTNVNATNLRQDLCIKTGTMSSEPLTVQILHAGKWQNLTTLTPNYFNNVSLAPYIDSTTLTIRFIDGNNATDPIQDSWNIDAVYLQDEPDINFLVNLQQSTFTMEVLQNGTMRWLGQNMQLTTQTLPIPPIPVKAIHINQTINGVNQEVPFQIEDWGSNYQIPLGLTSNTTLFGNRQMIVFLLNGKVSDFTVWWDGNDVATQTPLAFTNKYFTNDNPNANPPTLSNGYVTLSIGGFNVKATVGSTSSTSNFIRINQQASTYGAGAAFVIHHGIVRDVIQQEAEWNNGPPGSPNLYANIVLTLPANATYYTYQLRIMFIDSAQIRSITDLSPIQLATSLSSPQLQTENGTLAGSPILQNGTGTFINGTSGSWTQHHFSQFTTQDNVKGAGIMFTDIANQKLYAFDSFAGSSSKGGLKVGAASLEMDPVSSGQVPFTFAYDITWQGAVATFDGTTPLCNLYDSTTPMGLWILVEYPPTLTVTPKS
jgi:hypothetical protein